MTSSAGECGGVDLPATSGSGRELPSVSVPLCVDPSSRRGRTTSSPVATNYTAATAVETLHRRDGDDDRGTAQRSESPAAAVADRCPPEDDVTDGGPPASSLVNDVTRSRDDDDDDTPPTTASRPSFSSGDDPLTSSSAIASAAAASRGYMHLRSKTSRESQADVELEDVETMTSTTTRRSERRRQRTRDVCRPLRHWLYGHRDAPYPSRADKLQLAADTQLSLTQISNWFANARRRLKNTVDRAVTQQQQRGRSATAAAAAAPDVVGGLAWAERIRLYNRHTVGNQERLSISSGDESDDDQRAGIAADFDDGQLLDDVTGCRDNDAVGKYAGDGEAGRMLVGERVKAAAMAVAESGIHLVVDRRPTFVVVPTADGSGGVIDDDDLERLRHRNASGSLSSHDYEEMSTASSSASLRSTPTYEQRQHHCGHQQLPYRGHSPRLALDFDDCTDYPYCNSSQRGAMYDAGSPLHWKEISAALALTTLANSRLQTRRT